MERNSFLDAYRGVSLVSMLFFHGYYDLVFVFGWIKEIFSPGSLLVWQQSIVLSFIAIAGASTCYSHHLVRRGVELNLWGLLITGVTYFFLPSEHIIFGVLSFLGTAMLLLSFFQERLLSINKRKDEKKVLITLGIAAFSCFLLTQGLSRGYFGFYGVVFLPLSLEAKGDLVSFILGLPTRGIFSADYVPLCPHFFMFILGRVLWQYHLSLGRVEAEAEKEDKEDKDRGKGDKKENKKSDTSAACNIIEENLGEDSKNGILQPLIFLGQHSLIFYLLHQIILYGIFSLFA